MLKTKLTKKMDGDDTMEKVFSKIMGENNVFSNSVADQNNINEFYDQNYNLKNDYKDDVGNVFKEEVIAQTYFIRNYVRDILDNKQYQLHENEYQNLTFKGKKIQEWFENSYDFNKSYSKDPPIGVFLESYFKEGIINNYYLFYVVSNNDESKCVNQIKFISDSKNFVDTIKLYKPDSE
jgi:hypothetical protein